MKSNQTLVRSNVMRLFGTIAFTAVIIFTMTAATCGKDGDGKSSGGGAQSAGPKLTISNLPDNDYAVYVFSTDADLSNFLSIGMAVANQSMTAAGGRNAGTPNTFTMILWDEKYFSDAVNAALRDEDIPENITFWNGSGAYQVLLLSVGTDVNPLGIYRKANIRFSNGSATAKYSDFAEVSFSFDFNF